MVDEKYVLNCPHCGRVEGFTQMMGNDDDTSAVDESVIEHRDVRTSRGTSTRVRCPRCKRWIQSDRVHPA